MDKVNRKITVEEEADLYEKEALSEIKKQRFNGTEEIGKPYSTLQMGRRVVYRAKQELASRVEVVRCKDCKHYNPAHFKADDGTVTPWDETFSFDERSDGIYYGARCKHERNTAYGEKDMAYRKPDDFCSYGERKDNEN